MLKFLNILINVIIFITLAKGIYVPESTRSVKVLNAIDFKENKPLTRDLSFKTENKYLFKLNTNNNDHINDNYDVNNEHNTAQQAKTFKNAQQQQQQLLPIPLKQKSYDIDDDVANVMAKNLTNKPSHYIKNLEAQPITGFEVAATKATKEHLQQQQQQPTEIIHNNDVLIETEQQEEQNDSYSTLPHSRQKRQLSDFLIAPNTRWCGRGNTANGTYNHLGGASMADKCCRTHDHCKLYIPGMSNRFDLFNYRPYTLSHCNCDRRFRTCLKMANDEDAKTIGKLFFNLVQTQCFVLAKEVVCQERAKDGTCLKEHIKQKAYLRNNKKF